MPTFVVRVWLADRPGALGAVASKIGLVGGDLVGIDILERGAGRAVDELAVDLVHAEDVPALVREISSIEGVDVESVRPLAGSLPDPRLDALESAIALVEARTADDVLSTLSRRVHRDAEADWVAVVDHHTGSVVASAGKVPEREWLVAFIRGTQAGPEAAPDDVAWTVLDASDLTLLLGRSGRPVRSRERRQLTALGRVADMRWVDLIASQLHR